MNGGVDLTFFHDVMEMEPGRTGNNTEITEPEIRLFLSSEFTRGRTGMTSSKFRIEYSILHEPEGQAKYIE